MERLLQPTLSLPVFRIPFFAIPAVANPGSLMSVLRQILVAAAIDIEELRAASSSRLFAACRRFNLHIHRCQVLPGDERTPARRRASSHRTSLRSCQSASLFRRHRTIEEDPEEQAPDRSGTIQNPAQDLQRHGTTRRRRRTLGAWISGGEQVPALAESPMETATKAGASSVRLSCPHSLPARAWSVSFSVAPENLVLGLRLSPINRPGSVGICQRRTT
jgi:hypothetical protein